MTANVNPPETRAEVMPDRGLAPLDEILCTEELWRRPHRPPNYETESKALGKLAEALAQSPRTILQTLADTLLSGWKRRSIGSYLNRHEGKAPAREFSRRIGNEVGELRTWNGRSS